MRRCNKCVLPETIPNISFDQEGVCNQCTNYRPIVVPYGEHKLLELFTNSRKEGQEYDCILGVSGGRDSSYGLWLLSRHYGFKVLAVHYRSPFSHPSVYDNVKRMTDIAGVPLIEIAEKKRIHEKTFQNNIKAFFRQPSPGMISMMCVACKNMWIDMYEIAKDKKIPLIVECSNPFEETSFKREFHGIRFDEFGPKIYLKRLWAGIRELKKNPAYINLETLTVTMKAFMFLDSQSPFPRFLYPGIKKFELFYYLGWDEKQVLSKIQSELGWKKPDDEASTWRFDCQIGMVKDFIYGTLFGFTEKDDLYSMMIREGLISRKEALVRLERENNVSIQRLNHVLKAHGLDVEGLFSLNKDYWSQYAHLLRPQ